VQDGVNACSLPEEHGDRRDDEALGHGASAEERTNGYELQLEGVPCCEVAQARPVFCNSSLLKQTLHFDFEEFELDQFEVLR